MERPEVDFERIPQFFATTNDLIWLTQHCENDAYLSMRLAFHMMVLPLTRQLTNLAGNLWSRTLVGGRAERNEYLLLHEFYKSGYIVPDKQYGYNKPHENTDASKKNLKIGSQAKKKGQPKTEQVVAEIEAEEEEDDGMFTCDMNTYKRRAFLSCQTDYPW